MYMCIYRDRWYMYMYDIDTGVKYIYRRVVQYTCICTLYSTYIILFTCTCTCMCTCMCTYMCTYTCTHV